MDTIKEADLTKAVDAKYLRCIDENGRSVMISKESLSSLIFSLCDFIPKPYTNLDTREEFNIGRPSSGVR